MWGDEEDERVIMGKRPIMSIRKRIPGSMQWMSDGRPRATGSEVGTFYRLYYTNIC